jgi:hypothetical protein
MLFFRTLVVYLLQTFLVEFFKFPVQNGGYNDKKLNFDFTGNAQKRQPRGAQKATHK